MLFNNWEGYKYITKDGFDNSSAKEYKSGVKNPEYTIGEYLGDRKGVMSERGITAGFKSAKKQGCKIVVIDLDQGASKTSYTD